MKYHRLFHIEQNARVAIRNLNQKISKLDQETLQKLEIIYKKVGTRVFITK